NVTSCMACRRRAAAIRLGAQRPLKRCRDQLTSLLTCPNARWAGVGASTRPTEYGLRVLASREAWILLLHFWKILRTADPLCRSPWGAGRQPMEGRKRL